MGTGFVSIGKIIDSLIDDAGNIKQRRVRFMSKSKKEPETRVIAGNYRVLYKAEIIAQEEGREEAEKYLRARGLIGDNEKFFSIECEIDDEGQPIWPYDGGFYRLRAVAVG